MSFLRSHSCQRQSWSIWKTYIELPLTVQTTCIHFASIQPGRNTRTACKEPIRCFTYYPKREIRQVSMFLSWVPQKFNFLSIGLKIPAESTRIVASPPLCPCRLGKRQSWRLGFRSQSTEENCNYTSLYVHVSLCWSSRTWKGSYLCWLGRPGQPEPLDPTETCAPNLRTVNRNKVWHVTRRDFLD